MTTDTLRAAFEAFVTSPPFERSILRHGEASAWPGNYCDINVDLAWHAWQKSAALAAPVREPLTQPWRDQLIEAHCGGYELGDGEYEGMLAFIDSVERAHGIGSMAAAPQAAPAVPDDVAKAARSFVDNGYRGPLPWAKLVFDWVAARPQAGQAGQLRPDSTTHNDRIQPPRAATEER